MTLHHRKVERHLQRLAADLPIWPYLLPMVERVSDSDGYGSLTVTYRGPHEMDEVSYTWEACVGMLAVRRPKLGLTFDAKYASPSASRTTADVSPGKGDSHLTGDERTLNPGTSKGLGGVNPTPSNVTKGSKVEAKKCPPPIVRILEGRTKYHSPPAKKRKRGRNKGGEEGHTLLPPRPPNIRGH